MIPFQACSKTIVRATVSNVLQMPSLRRFLRHAHYRLASATTERQAIAVVGYSRVSTCGEGHRLQLDPLQMAGYNDVVSEVRTGADQNTRPKLRCLLSDPLGGDIVIVLWLDRMPRSVKELIAIANEFSERKVRLRSLDEHIDTTTPQYRMMFHVFAIVARFERDLIGGRTRAGLEAARASGRIVGRRRHLVPAQIAQAQVSLAIKQITQAQGAKALGISRATLIRAIFSG
jgi:DNA invertase Pin-like site-specific DNA recombinase